MRGIGYVLGDEQWRSITSSNFASRQLTRLFLNVVCEVILVVINTFFLWLPLLICEILPLMLTMIQAKGSIVGLKTSEGKGIGPKI